MAERLSWTAYYMHLAEEVALRSTCVRRQVGAVAVDPYKMVIGTGYNGAPSKMEHCTRDTCIRVKMKIPSGKQLETCKAIHAEQNLVIKHGPELKGATIYCTTRPCTTCMKLLIGCKVQEIIWKNNYDDEYATELLREYTHSEITTDENGYYHAACVPVQEQKDPNDIFDDLYTVPRSGMYTYKEVTTYEPASTEKTAKKPSWFDKIFRRNKS